jgi:transcriptional regulator with PAS, ATPase and Fis domain
VLQEKEILRVGGAKAIPVNTRVIAATNVNLERAMQQGTFREDLYYRLNVLPIIIPPLRYRKEDIPAIAMRLIHKYNQEYGRGVERISPEAIKKLLDYDWPGNVRELENAIGRAMINMKFTETVMEPHHLIFYGQQPSADGGHAALPLSRLEWPENGVGEDLRSLEEVVSEAERRHIVRVLEQTKGNKTEAAKRLGIAVRSLYYKLEKYGIH